MSEPLYEIDRAIAQLLAQVHPLHLSQLRAQLLLVLASTTGIGSGDRILAELAGVRNVNELARVDWEELSTAAAMASDLPEPTCRAIVLHIRLFAERAVLHHCLFLAKSASTLRLLDSWPVRYCGLPDELGRTNDEFDQALREADRALGAGRACLWAFAQLVQKGGTLQRIQALLKRANACYAYYLQALQQADELAGYISWYLTQQAESPGEVEPAARSAWDAA